MVDNIQIGKIYYEDWSDIAEEGDRKGRYVFVIKMYEDMLRIGDDMVEFYDLSNPHEKSREYTDVAMENWSDP